MTASVPRILGVFLLGTSVLVQGQVPISPPMPAGSNVLVGRVVEVGTGAPVGGVIVTLVGHFDASGKPATPDPSRPTAGLPPSLNVMTTASGYFVFRNLPAGRFNAATRAFGYTVSDFPPTLIDIVEGQKPPEIRLGVWKYAALSGRVIDDDGEPIAGIVVHALRRTASGSGIRLRRAGIAVTDDRGIYRLAQLAPGRYAVGVLSTTTTLPAAVSAALDPSAANRETFGAMRVTLIQSGFFGTYGCPECISNSHEGYALGGFVLQRPGLPLPPAPDGRPLDHASTFFPGTSNPRDAGLVSVGSGESRSNVDLTVRLRPTVSVEGMLLGPDGPMPHVTLRLAPPGADLNDLETPGVATAITDGRGQFVFLSTTPGDYTLSAAIASEASATTGQAARRLWASQPVSVGDKGLAGLTVAMQPGTPLSGRVEFRTDSGLAAQPAQRQVVTLQPMGAAFWRTLQTVIQSNGSFRSVGDPPGRYIINANSPPGWFWQKTTLAGNALLDEAIELGSAELSGVVLTFGRTTNRVSGRVIDETGAPDRSATVIVFPADSTLWREGIFGRRTRSAHTTSEGAYEISTMPPGDYFLAAVSKVPGQEWQDPELLERLTASAARVTLGVEDQKIVALRTATLPGRVR